MPDGARIKALREAKSLSQDNFLDTSPGGAAEGIGSVNPRTVRRAEKGKSVQADSLLRIARILEVPLDEIVQNTGEECPFKGLAFYDDGDAAIFGGRDKATTAVLRLLDAEKAVCILGDSGSGKSSLASAGVIPKFRSRPGAAVVLQFRPGESPILAMLIAMRLAGGQTLSDSATKVLVEDAAAAVAGNDTAFIANWVRAQGTAKTAPTILIYLDALETVFRPSVGAAERRVFFEALANVAHNSDRNAAALVLGTLRADYAGDLIGSNQGLFSQPGIYALLPMKPDELQEAILVPARSRNLTFDPGIVASLAQEAHANPDSLPHLSTCLEQLWEQRDRARQHVDHIAFNEVGGIAGAIDRHAEDAYEHLISEGARVHIEGALCALAEYSRTGRAFGIRRNLADLPAAEALALDELADESIRLVTLGGSGRVRHARITHEVLFGAWARLRDWLRANRRFRNWEAFLDAEMSAHKFSRRGALLSGWRLSQARAMRRRYEVRLKPAQLEFIRHSENAETRRRAVLAVALVSLLTLAVVAGMVWDNERSAWQQERLDQAYELAVHAQREFEAGDFNAATLLAARALPNAAAPDWPAVAPAVEVAERLLRLRHYVPPSYESYVMEEADGIERPIIGYDVSEDGQTVLVASARSLHVYDHGEYRTYSLPDDFATAQVLVSARVGGIVYRDLSNGVGFVNVKGEVFELHTGYEQEGTTYRFSDAPGDGTLLVLKSSFSTVSLARHSPTNLSNREWVGCDGDFRVTPALMPSFDLSQSHVMMSPSGNALIGPEAFPNPEAIRSMVRIVGDHCQYMQARSPGVALLGDADSDLAVETDDSVGSGSSRVRKFSDRDYTCDLGDYTMSALAVLRDAILIQRFGVVTLMSDTCVSVGAPVDTGPHVGPAFLDLAFESAEQVLLSTPNGAWLHCRHEGVGCERVAALENMRAGRGGGPPGSSDKAWARRSRSREEPYFVAMFLENGLFFRREDMSLVGVVDLAPEGMQNNPVDQLATSGAWGMGINHRRDRFFLYDLDRIDTPKSEAELAEMTPTELSAELLRRLPSGWLELPEDAECLFGSFPNPIVQPAAPSELIPINCGLPSAEDLQLLLP